MDEKKALVYRWIRSSFVSGGSVGDNLYDMSRGNFDSSMPFEGMDTRNPTETVWFYAQPDDYAVVPSAE